MAKFLKPTINTELCLRRAIKSNRCSREVSNQIIASCGAFSRRWIKFIILFYQKILSPKKGIMRGIAPVFWGCRFFPTCSEYAFEAIEKYGALRGCFLAAKRILRCQPFNKGGYDPIPKFANSKSQIANCCDK